MKDEFLATLSHELRTPLNAMLGYTRMLRSSAIPDERRENALAVIERNGKLLSQIVDDVLDMSRIVSGKLRLNIQPVELSRSTSGCDHHSRRTHRWVIEWLSRSWLCYFFRFRRDLWDLGRESSAPLARAGLFDHAC